MKRIALFLALGLLAGACSSTKSSVTGSWLKEDITPVEHDNALVIAVSSNLELRTYLEKTAAQVLKERKFQNVHQSVNLYGPDLAKPDAMKAQVEQSIQEKDLDLIYSVVIKNVDSETRYVPPTVSTVPTTGYYRPYGPYYGSYRNYYPTTYQEVYQPGYYVESKTYFLETNIYDAKTEELLWSAQSATVNPSNVNTFSKSYMDAIIRQFRKDTKGKS